MSQENDEKLICVTYPIWVIISKTQNIFICLHQDVALDAVLVQKDNSGPRVISFGKKPLAEINIATAKT